MTRWPQIVWFRRRSSSDPEVPRACLFYSARWGWAVSAGVPTRGCRSSILGSGHFASSFWLRCWPCAGSQHLADLGQLRFGSSDINSGAKVGARRVRRTVRVRAGSPSRLPWARHGRTLDGPSRARRQSRSAAALGSSASECESSKNGGIAQESIWEPTFDRRVCIGRPTSGIRVRLLSAQSRPSCVASGQRLIEVKSNRAKNPATWLEFCRCRGLPPGSLSFGRNRGQPQPYASVAIGPDLVEITPEDA